MQEGRGGWDKGNGRRTSGERRDIRKGKNGDNVESGESGEIRREKERWGRNEGARLRKNRKGKMGASIGEREGERSENGKDWIAETQKRD